MFGVNGAVVAFQHPGAAEKPGTVPQPAQGQLVGGGIGQQPVQLRVLERGTQAAADDQHVQVVQGRAVDVRGIDLQAQVTGHPFAAQGKRCAQIQLALEQVGRDQYVHRHGKAGHGEVLQQQETHLISRGTGRHRVFEIEHVAGAGFLAELAWGGQGAAPRTGRLRR
ncbi:hypothetical protein D3C80_1043650 [compost metagenome]